MELLKGAPVAEAILSKVKETLEAHPELKPRLAIVRVGEKPEDISYERSAVKAFKKAGLETQVYAYPADIAEEDFLQAFEEINRDPAVSGILLFRPLPKSFHEERVRRLMAPEKDIDCVSVVNQAGIFSDSAIYYPCTAEAVIRLIEHYKIETAWKKAVIIGRSLVIGKPAALMLLKKNATVTICHTRTADVAAEARQADILVASAGRAEMVDESYVKEGAVLIDVGINVREDGSLVGDCKVDSVSQKASMLTPVPGGIGRITTAVLIEHTVRAALLQAEG